MSQASGYGMTHRMIAGLSLGAALAADLYTTKRDKHQATQRRNEFAFHSGGALIDEPPPATEQQPLCCFQLGGCMHLCCVSDSPPVFVHHTLFEVFDA